MTVDAFDDERLAREAQHRNLIVEALSRRADELRQLHHAHVVLDANAREKIADIALGALGLLGPGDPCRCEGRGQCYGAAICASVHPAEQCRQFTIGWPQIASRSGE